MTRSPEGPSGRVHRRYDVDWRVTLKCRDWRVAGRVAAQNASRGGLFLLTSKPVPAGSQVELTIELPDGGKLALAGTVAHVVTPERAAAEGRSPGIGVKLDPRHATDLMLLEQMAAAERSFEAPAPRPEDEAAPAAEQDDEERDEEAAPPPAPSPPPTPAFMIRPPVARAVGIDFGTTYSSVSVATADRVWLIPDDEGRVLQPSIVSVPARGAPIVGWEARERQVSDPRRTIASAKRLLGRSFSDPLLAGYLHAASYATVAGPDDSILVDLDGERLAVPQICASVIARVRDVAEERLGTRVREVVLSAPASYSETEKAALRRAAQLAGLEVIGLIEEPVAGALGYGLGRVNELVVVYDFGGGTFDCSVLDLSGDRWRVLASEGDAWLGGDDFDLSLAQAVADAIWRATRIELRKRVVEWQRLLLACELAKRTLSTETVAQVVVDRITEAPRRIDLRQKIERAVFETLCRELVTRSLDACVVALARAGLEPRDVTQVVMTGGVSRMPMVRQAVSTFFERDVIAVVSPEEAICLGTGLRAAQIVGHPIGRR